MEVSSVTYHGWRDNFQTVERRVTFDYEKGNDVTVVETKSYLVMLYDASGKQDNITKGNNIDQMV